MTDKKCFRSSNLDRLKCSKKLVAELTKAGWSNTSFNNLFELWIAVYDHYIKHSPHLQIHNHSTSVSICIKDNSTPNPVVYISKTIKPAFGQAIVAYVKLCTTSE